MSMEVIKLGLAFATQHAEEIDPGRAQDDIEGAAMDPVLEALRVARAAMIAAETAAFNARGYVEHSSERAVATSRALGNVCAGSTNKRAQGAQQAAGELTNRLGQQQTRLSLLESGLGGMIKTLDGLLDTAQDYAPISPYATKETGECVKLRDAVVKETKAYIAEL